VKAARTHRGFSVIELMVTVAIIALLMVFGMPMYGTWLQNSQLRASAESIMAGLQFARSEAVRRNDTQGVQLSLTGNAWSVSAVADLADPTKVLRQGGGPDLAANAVVAPNPADKTNVTFTSLGMTQDPVTKLAITVDIDVTHANRQCIAAGGDIRCLRVQVRSGGLVRVCDPSVATAGDPRQCI
jgi:type IV fimbrial biogenesis protein FimT